MPMMSRVARLVQELISTTGASLRLVIVPLLSFSIHEVNARTSLPDKAQKIGCRSLIWRVSKAGSSDLRCLYHNRCQKRLPMAPKLSYLMLISLSQKNTNPQNSRQPIPCQSRFDEVVTLGGQDFFVCFMRRWEDSLLVQ